MAVDSISSPIRNLSKALNEQKSSFEKLSSGKRITRASDDAAGLAVAAALNAEASTLAVGSRNASYSQSAIDIAGSALTQISDIAGRLGELATQAASGTLSDSQRSTLNQEYQALTQEVSRIAETTQFNGTSLLKGDQISAQVGTDSSADSQIASPGVDINGIAAAVVGGSISTANAAQSAITAVNSFVSDLASAQGKLGATYSRLDSAINNNDVGRENRIAAASRIEDVDYAAEFAKKVATDIKAKSSVAVSAQANQSAATVLNLLK